jgi:hypothetical protein
MLVNQYSISENEYLYWDKLRNIVEQVGSIYDITPASIPGNITCVEKPDETVLGYFSVSSVKSRRIFIQELFRGMPDLYSDCENVVVGYNDSIPGLNTSVWVIIANRPIKVLTYFKGCADCTDRGTKIEPDFWKEGK